LVANPLAKRIDGPAADGVENRVRIAAKTVKEPIAAIEIDDAVEHPGLATEAIRIRCGGGRRRFRRPARPSQSARKSESSPRRAFTLLLGLRARNIAFTKRFGLYEALSSARGIRRTGLPNTPERGEKKRRQFRRRFCSTGGDFCRRR
jgi:hypothetical protein